MQLISTDGLSKMNVAVFVTALTDKAGGWIQVSGLHMCLDAQ